MKRLFLSSYFTSVADLFPEFMENEHSGKRVTFIPTAANPEKVRFYVDSDKKVLEKLGLVIDVLDIAVADHATIASKLTGNDMIFVAGGNTFYLLQELRRTGADRLLTDEIMNGKPYIGSSAGSIILARNIEYIKRMDSPKMAPELSDFASLGLIDFYPLPHFTNAPFKKIAEKIFSEYEGKIDLRPISNDQVITVIGEQVACTRV